VPTRLADRRGCEQRIRGVVRDELVRRSVVTRLETDPGELAPEGLEPSSGRVGDLLG
jgi:hypothetical protein